MWWFNHVFFYYYPRKLAGEDNFGAWKNLIQPILKVWVDGLILQGKSSSSKDGVSKDDDEGPHLEQEA